MPNQPIFKWKIEVIEVEGEQQLALYLNDGINRIISIEHEDYYKNLSDLLLEIIHCQYRLGTKTKVNVYASQEVQKANILHEEWKKSAK